MISITAKRIVDTVRISCRFIFIDIFYLAQSVLFNEQSTKFYNISEGEPIKVINRKTRVFVNNNLSLIGAYKNIRKEYWYPRSNEANKKINFGKFNAINAQYI